MPMPDCCIRAQLDGPAVDGLTFTQHGDLALSDNWPAGVGGGPAQLCRVRQVHGAAVVEADPAATPEADALWTRVPGRVLAIQTADCLPVILAAKGGEAVAVAHAGWRGLAAGVLGNTVASLPVVASELTAWIGPAIGAAVYEVGEDVRSAFDASHGPAAAGFFVPGPVRGKWRFDLIGLGRQTLLDAGVAGVRGGAWCTYSNPDRFWSYRRDGAVGRLVTVAWINA